VRAFITVGGLLVLATLVAAPGAPAQGAVGAAKAQLQTAIFHAGELAQRGNVVAASKTHLQHVLNCLEGPRGEHFNAAAGDVCRGQGSGIMPDLQAALAGGVAGAERALRFARAAQALILEALQSNDVNLVQPYGLAVANQLKSALAALP